MSEAVAFVGPAARGAAPAVTRPASARPSPESASASAGTGTATAAMFTLGTAGAAACRRAARGLTAAKKVPKAKVQSLGRRSVTTPLFCSKNVSGNF